MAQYDGSIRIGTGIDEKGFKAGSKELEAGARSLAKSVSDSLGEGAKIALQKQTDAFVKLNQQYAAQEQKVKDLAAKLHDVQRQKIETAEFKELSKDLDKAKASLDRLYDRRDSYVELGKKVPPKLDLDISDAERKIRLLEGDIKELQLTNKAYIPADTTKVQQELAAAEQKQMQIYTALQTAADSISQKTNERIAKEETVREKIAAEAAEEERLDQIRVNAVATNDQIIAKVERLRQLEQEIADLKAAERTEGYADYDNRIIEADQLKQDIREYRDSLSEVPEKFARMRAAAQKAFNVISSGFILVEKVAKKVLGGTLKLWGKTFLSTIKLSTKLFSSIINGSKRSNSSLSGGLKTLLRYGLGIRSVYALFNKIRSGITEGFKNLMGYSDSFANSVQSVKNSMSTLGNQIAAAFAPIVQMVIPWLNSLISALSNAMTYVAQFIAALTGKSTFTKATQIQDKYNKSLGGTAKAADKARGALAKFDDLDVLQKQEDASGGGGAAVTDPADMFEEVKVEDRFKNIADMFKNMLADSDFSSFGAMIGEKLKSALENIPWDGIKEKARSIGESISTLINGFIGIDGLGFSIGNTLAQAFNTGFEFLNSFVHSLNWESVGTFIADTVNGFFTGIDWELIHDTFVTGAQGIGEAINSFFSNIDLNAITDSVAGFVNTFVDTTYTLFATVDWLEIGRSIGKFITDSIAKIDWGKMGQTVSIMLTSILDLIIATIETIDWAEIWKAIIDFLTNVNWLEILGKIIIAAYNLIEGIVVGLVQAIMETDWGAIWDSILQAFKDFFGIHSPSTVMEEMGTYIMEGLISGIRNLVNSVIEIWNGLKQSTLKIFDDLWSGIKKVINGIIGGVETMANGIVRAINKMIEALNSIKFSIPDWVPGSLGGKSFGLNLSTIPEVSIPRLATGAVLRGGNPFMAILNDQPAGKTNIEAPLSTIEQAVENVMSRQGYGRESVPVNINLNYDGETFARLSISDILSELNRQGYNVEVLEG